MPAKTRGWWKRLPDDCPISLESIESLDYPPFDLVMDESHTTYFDGFQLAEYLVSYGSFRHPITRRDITRDECEQLDAYLREHRPGFLAGVLHAFDHQEEYNLSTTWTACRHSGRLSYARLPTQIRKLVLTTPRRSSRRS